MSEKDKDPCTCKSSLSHYLVVLGGVLRIVSLIVGILFSGEVAQSHAPWTETRRYFEKFVELVEDIVDKVSSP